MESYFSWIESLYPSWQRNAEQLYGARGYMGAIAHGWRHGAAIAGWHEWTGAAGWLSAYFIEHYQVTGDETFLRDRVVPLLENAPLNTQVNIVPGRLRMLLRRLPLFCKPCTPSCTPIRCWGSGKSAFLN